MVKNKSFGQLMEAGRSPSFFKILRRGDLSSEINRMIPNQLLRSISESFSFKMVFKVPWGSSWIVKLSKNPTFYYMEDCGWNKFVEDNGLGDDEYLSFTHEGNMCFNVTIFEADGSEMLRPRRPEAIPSSSSRNKSEERKRNYVEVKEEQEIESLSESSHPGLKKAESASGRLKQKQELNLRKKKAEEGEKNKKKVRTANNDGIEMVQPRRPLPIAYSSSGNKREGKRIISIEVKEEQEIESLSESSYSGLKTAECASRRLKKKRKLILGKTKAEKAVKSKRKKRNVEAAYNDSEDNSLSLCLSLGPEFIITITTSYLIYLGVPKKFADMHMPKETTWLKIRNEEGSKSWDVMYRRLGIEARFNAGWIGLVRDLGLEKGDVCRFTLIKPTEMNLKVCSKATP